MNVIIGKDAYVSIFNKSEHFMKMLPPWTGFGISSHILVYRQVCTGLVARLWGRGLAGTATYP
jgi:hypothetical protein